MNVENYVNRLDELNKLKKEGLISENEYEIQINKLKKDYLNKSNIYERNKINNSTSHGTNILASLILLCICIVGVFYFSPDAIKDLWTIFTEDNYSNISTNNHSTYSSIDYNLNNSSSINLASSISSTEVATESKSSYTASCKDYSSKYSDMQRTPNSYKGLRMKFTGMVEDRWSKDGKMVSFTLSACTNDNRHIGMVYCTIDDSVLNGGNLLQYDKIIVYGEFKGLSTNLYTIYGYADYPYIDVKYIEFINL